MSPFTTKVKCPDCGEPFDTWMKYKLHRALDHKPPTKETGKC